MICNCLALKAKLFRTVGLHDIYLSYQPLNQRNTKVRQNQERILQRIHNVMFQCKRLLKAPNIAVVRDNVLLTFHALSIRKDYWVHD
jgi:hypothetical protein